MSFGRISYIAQHQSRSVHATFVLLNPFMRHAHNEDQGQCHHKVRPHLAPRRSPLTVAQRACTMWEYILGALFGGILVEWLFTGNKPPLHGVYAQPGKHWWGRKYHRYLIGVIPCWGHMRASDQWERNRSASFAVHHAHVRWKICDLVF